MQHTVSEIMHTELWTIDTRASLLEAQELMQSHSVRRLPVLNQAGELVGILSWGDVREATSLEAAQSGGPYAPDAVERWLSVWEVMTHDPLVVTPKTSLADAVELMLNRKIGALPVVLGTTGASRRRLVGIITDSDIFRLVLRLWRNEERQETLLVASY